MADLARGKTYTGHRMKPDDRWTTPLCSPIPGAKIGCHGLQHTMQERKFWQEYHLDPFAIAERLWAESGAAERHRFDAPGPAVRKPRKARPRTPKVKRAWAKREFPKGRGFNR